MRGKIVLVSLAAATIGAGNILMGCAPVSPLPARVADLDPASCPTVANVHPADLARMLSTPVDLGSDGDMLSQLDVPTDKGPIPPPDATVVIKTRVPAGGGYSADDQSIVWRDSQGVWRGWHRRLNADPGMPPPPPPPGSPGEEEAYSTSWNPFPDHMGVLSPEATSALETAYSNPCRQLEPDAWMTSYRLRHSENGSRRRICQTYQDSSTTYAEITEPGRGRRRVWIACGPPDLTSVLVNQTAYVQLPELPLRKMPPKE